MHLRIALKPWASAHAPRSRSKFPVDTEHLFSILTVMKPLPHNLTAAQTLQQFQTLADLDRNRRPGQQRLDWPDLVGRLVEVVGGARSMRLAWLAQVTTQVQAAGDVAVWLQTTESTPFPPDLARAGVALDRLPMLRLADFQAQLRAADVLLRSGAFGLCAIDATAATQRALDASRSLDNALGRLLGLCQKHAAALVFLTPEPSQQENQGFLQTSLVSLRLTVARDRQDPRRLQVDVKKDKRLGPATLRAEVSGGPDGFEL